MPIQGTNGDDIIDINEEYAGNPEDGEVNALAGDDLIIFSWAFFAQADPEDPEPLQPDIFDVDGGLGLDTLQFSIDGDPEETPAVVLDARTGNLGGMTFTSIERVILSGASGGDTLYGLDGDDILNGRGGVDHLYGGDGDDSYAVQSSNDEVFENAGEGEDTVRLLGDGRFTLPDNVENLTLVNGSDGRGNDLANRILGNGLANEIDGEAGADFIDGGAGADIMRGGRNGDTYVVDNVGDSVREISGGLGGTDTVRSSVSFTLGSYVENLVLTGASGIDGTGNALNNVMTGNSAANTLSGGAGHDRLDGGAGADVLQGGTGHDVYVVDNAGDQVIEGGSSGNDTVESSIDYSLPTHVERLVLTGTAGRDGRGNSGDNNIAGNSGGNLLNGGSGDDSIAGGGGNDLIYGSLGNDVLNGGAGLDRFLFNTAPGTGNVDRLVDFSVADDVINLASYVYTQAGPNGTLAESAFREGTAAADSSDRVVYNPETGEIFYDPDGNGGAAQILFATVAAGTPLTNADFAVYG
ncbi:MAG TPA: calcium-binding protein [Allosphingosinicella sp.]|nr:calcium-binding protein [Allosphingosinicella sp.]